MKDAHTYVVTCPNCQGIRTIHNIKFDRDIKKLDRWSMNCRECKCQVIIYRKNIEDITYTTTW